MNSYKGITSYQEEDSSLLLDPSVIKEKRQGGKSVTDGYEISVFTDEFQKHMSDYEKTHNQNAVGERIFVESMSNDKGINPEEFMFREPIMVTKNDYNTAKGNMTPQFYYWLFGVMFICFAVFLYRYITKGGKVHDHYDNPENGRM